MQVVVPSEKPQGLEFPSNIRKCLFQVMPMGQYAAQSEYEEKKNELEHLVGTDEDKDNNVKDYLDSLQESAEKEKIMNVSANERRIMEKEIVVYGAVIQLQHLKTRKYVSIDTNKLAKQEKDAFKHDQDGSGFEEHVASEHNKWHYLFYLIHCQVLNRTNPDEMNTYEQFVYGCYEKEEIKWMPLGECVSLKKKNKENTIEDEVNQLREDMDEMKGMMKTIMKTIALENGKKK
eukprot:g9422.t1